MVTKLEQIRGLGRSEVERRLAGGAVGAVRAVLPKMSADAAKIVTLQARIAELEAEIVTLQSQGKVLPKSTQRCPVCAARKAAAAARVKKHRKEKR